MSGNGTNTRVTGASIDKTMGCQIRASAEQKALAHDVMEGLFFVLAGNEADGERQAIWQAFDRLP